jgi:hypothetical protein
VVDEFTTYGQIGVEPVFGELLSGSLELANDSGRRARVERHRAALITKGAAKVDREAGYHLGSLRDQAGGTPLNPPGSE